MKATHINGASAMKLKKAKLSVRPSSVHGLGVYADQIIQKGSLIEQCAAIEVVDPQIIALLKNTKTYLINHIHTVKDKLFFLHGNGGLYNHANSPNADLAATKHPHLFHIRALRTIHKGEEIFLYYGEDWQNSHSYRTINPKEQLTYLQLVLKHPYAKTIGVVLALSILLKIF